MKMRARYTAIRQRQRTVIIVCGVFVIIRHHAFKRIIFSIICLHRYLCKNQNNFDDYVCEYVTTD